MGVAFSVSGAQPAMVALFSLTCVVANNVLDKVKTEIAMIQWNGTYPSSYRSLVVMKR